MMRRTLLVLLLLPLALLAACKTSLFEGIDEEQANRIVAVLSRHGIEGFKDRNADKTWNVSVDESHAVAATELAGAYALPRGAHANLGELFSRQGLIASPEEDHVRYVYGLTQEMAETLEKIDGVLDARVHIVDPPRDPLMGPAPQPSASVMLRYSSDAGLEQMRSKIRSLVAGAVEGLTPERVYVTFVPVMPVVTADEACRQTGVCPHSAPAPRATVTRVLIALTLMALLLSVAVWIWDSGIRTFPRIRIPGITFYRRRARGDGKSSQAPGMSADTTASSTSEGGQ